MVRSEAGVRVGLPPGEHEFRIWQERVGYLEKSLIITIKAGEESRSELEYAADRLKLTEAEVLGWGNRQIDSVTIARPRVPRPATPKKDDNAQAKVEKANQRIRDELARLTIADFQDNLLSDVTVYFSDYHNIPIGLDTSATEHLKGLGNSTVSLTFNEVDLATALSRLLYSSRLSYFIEGGELRIATPEEVRRRGHPVPESFAEVLAKLQAVDGNVPWEDLLLGRGGDSAKAALANDANLERLTKLLTHSDVVVQRQVVGALKSFGTRAASARPALE